MADPSMAIIVALFSNTLPAYVARARIGRIDLVAMDKDRFESGVTSVRIGNKRIQRRIPNRRTVCSYVVITMTS